MIGKVLLLLINYLIFILVKILNNFRKN